MPISGKDALAFLSGIDKAMEEAGGGQFRAFKLLAELEKIGLGIVSLDGPSAPVQALTLASGESQQAA